MMIPRSVSHAPLPVIPFLPLIINKPVVDRNINDTAKRSENHVQSFLGLL